MGLGTVRLISTRLVSVLTAQLTANAQPARQVAHIGVLCPITCTDPSLDVFGFPIVMAKFWGLRNENEVTDGVRVCQTEHRGSGKGASVRLLP